jgi:hypothetical protein
LSLVNGLSVGDDAAMTFADFYRDLYLPRHAEPACRWLHLLGVPAAAVYAVFVAWLGWWWLLLLIPAPAYALGWLGHLLAHNHPTFFQYPLLPFLGYWKMLAGMVMGRG